jgi:hypothetical protein
MDASRCECLLFDEVMTSCQMDFFDQWFGPLMLIEKSSASICAASHLPALPDGHWPLSPPRRHILAGQIRAVPSKLSIANMAAGL